MDLLERLRVFSPDVLYTMPYFAWERLALFVFGVALMFTFAKSLAPWVQSALAFSRVLPLSRPYLRDRIGAFNQGRVYYVYIFAPVAGGILGCALLYLPESSLLLIQDGFLDFSTLDLGGWVVMTAIAVMAWLALILLIFAILSYGLVVGLVDAAVFSTFAVSAFLVGWAAGPLSLLAFLNVRKYGDQSSGVFGHLFQFFIAPFSGLRELLLPGRMNKPKGKDKKGTRSSLSIRDALNTINSDD